MPKEKVNYGEVYGLYQLCRETKDLKEFCSEYGVSYEKFMDWRRHQLWNEKPPSKTVEVKQPDAAPVNIVGIPTVSPTVKMEQKKQEKPEPIRRIKVQQVSGASIFLRNTNVLDLSLMLNKLIG